MTGTHAGTPSRRLPRPAVVGALLTLICLLGGLLAGVALGNLVFGTVPSHLNESLRITIATGSALVGMLTGSALWGVLVGRLANETDTRRMGRAGMLGFVPITLVFGVALQLLEPLAVARLGMQLPVHRLFTLLFVPTTLLIAGTASAAIGIGVRNRWLAALLARRAEPGAALAFLVVNVAMEALGWQVGGPRAAERATMLMVMFTSSVGAALVGGALIGETLAHGRRP